MYKSKLGKIKWEEFPKWKSKKPVVWSCRRHRVSGKRIIELTIFHKTGKTMRIFASANDYITQDRNGAWRTASLNYIRAFNWRKCEVSNNDIVNNDSRKILAEFLKTKLVELSNFETWQLMLDRKKLAVKNKKITDRIDAQMKKINKMPTGFRKWAFKDGMPKSRYILYTKRSKDDIEGFCTYCEHKVNLSEAKREERIKCPHCGKTVQLFSAKQKKYIIDQGTAALIQRDKDEQLVIRTFSLSKHYDSYFQRFDNPPKADFNMKEINRYYPEKDKDNAYEWAHFKSTNIVRWCEGERYGYWYWNSLYPRGVNEALKFRTGIDKHNLTYCHVSEYVNGGYGDVRKFIQKYKEYPIFEFLARAHLKDLVDHILSYYYNTDDLLLQETSPCKALGVSKASLKEIVRNAENFKASDLAFVHELEKLRLKTDFKSIKMASEMNIAPETFEEIIRHVSLTKLYNFYSKANMNNKSDYKDYLRICIDIGKNLDDPHVLFPKSIEASHNKLLAEVQETNIKKRRARLKKLEVKVNKILKEEKKLYEYKTDNITIHTPDSCAAVIKQGMKLNQCIEEEWYLKKIADGSSIILFINQNDKPKKAYCTLEISRRHKFVQCRGFDNQEAPEEVMQVVNKFIDKLHKPNVLLRKEG